MVKKFEQFLLEKAGEENAGNSVIDPYGEEDWDGELKPEETYDDEDWDEERDDERHYREVRQCNICGRYVANIFIEDGICKDCMENDYYCFDCGARVPKQFLHFNANGELGMCDLCYANAASGNIDF